MDANASTQRQFVTVLLRPAMNRCLQKHALVFFICAFVSRRLTHMFAHPSTQHQFLHFYIRLYLTLNSNTIILWMLC